MANNQEITYAGYTAQPSDYECQDGDLAVSLNMLNENGALVPLSPPVSDPDVSLLDEDRILLLHKTATGNYYIIANRQSDGRDSVASLPVESGKGSRTPIDIISAVRSAVTIGNTVILATDSGLHYLLYKDFKYETLGSRPPFVTIDFGLEWGVVSSAGSIEYPHGDNAPIQSEINRLCTNHVYGLISELGASVSKNGKFWQPFFVRYALRLFDGSYIMHSPPVLMLPTTLPPLVHRCWGTDGDWSIYSRAFLASCGLKYRIVPSALAGMDQWRDIVAGIDVFVSAPIYTYNQAEDIDPGGIDKYAYINMQRFTLGPIVVCHAESALDPNIYRDYHDTDLNDLYVGWNEEGLNECWAIFKPLTFNEDIKNPKIFYKLAELDIKDVLDDTSKGLQRFKPLPIRTSEKDLRNLLTRQTLSDDFQAHCAFRPSVLHVYNSRLNIANISLSPPQPYPLRASYAFANEKSESVRTASAEITVYSRLNGVKVMSVQSQSTEANTPYNFPGNLPRYLFYPDPSAYKMKIKVGTDIYILELTPSDFLYGAYWFGGLGIVSMSEQNAQEETETALTEVLLANKLYTSEVNNPFLFTPQNVTTISNGSVKALSSAAKALSQGQFGQFPLYAFTDEGIWALEISPTGTISARQPITRDVCDNVKGITQIDSSVIFPTDRGIMMISGSQTQCLSDTINSSCPFDCISRLPQMEALHEMLGHDTDKCLSVAPLPDFLEDCGIIYDYPHQRIIVYSPAYRYAYIYSLKSHLWGMMHLSVAYTINAYPEAIAITTDNKLIRISHSVDQMIKSIIVTRPLKLGAPHILKTVNSVIQRGNFRKGHVQAVLYGSRDLMNWHLVWSSKDHFLRGFRGTPYKYFRIALLCNLASDESIYGASVQFTPRLTNQPR